MIYNTWEEDFDKQFPAFEGTGAQYPIFDPPNPNRNWIKAFIKKEIEKVSLEYEGKITEAEKRGFMEGQSYNMSDEMRMHVKSPQELAKEWVDEGKKIGRAEARTEALREVLALVKENRKGTFTDDGGNDGWYLDELIKAIEALNIKE